MFTSILMVGSIVALFLVVWFKTEAYVEYCRLFRLNKISNYREYFAEKANDVSLTYHKFLRQYHDGFFVRLATCPICVSAWLSIGLALLSTHLMLFPPTFIVSLILFGIIHRLLN